MVPKHDQDKEPKKSSFDHGQDEEKSTYDQEFENLSDEEKLENLIKTLKKVEKQRKFGKQKPSQPKRPMIMLEFGGTFHPSALINFLMYYVINLLVIYGVATVFNLASFQGELWVALSFVLLYTLAETLLRTYILYHHVTLVFRSLGFIFFFGYVTLFFVIDAYAFPNATKFASPVDLVAFTGIFVLIRYLLALWVKQVRDGRGYRG